MFCLWIQATVWAFVEHWRAQLICRVIYTRVYPGPFFIVFDRSWTLQFWKIKTIRKKDSINGWVGCLTWLALMYSWPHSGAWGKIIIGEFPLSVQVRIPIKIPHFFSIFCLNWWKKRIREKHFKRVIYLFFKLKTNFTKSMYFLFCTYLIKDHFLQFSEVS